MGMVKNTEIIAPSGSVERHLEPWQIIDWSGEQLRAIYTDWGNYFALKQNFKAATRYLDAALEIQPNDPIALSKRSRIKRLQARAPDALTDCIAAKTILKESSPSRLGTKNYLEICSALYESNHFEQTKRYLHDLLRGSNSEERSPVLKHIRTVNSNIHDALSEETAPAIRRLIDKMTSHSDKKPMSVKPECDVLSILEKEEELLSPLEIQRRKRQFKIYNQTYLQKSWMDVSFLKDVRGNPNLLLQQCAESTKEIENLTKQNYKTVRTFTKMLHARCPMYSSNLKRYPNKDLHLKQEQENLFRIQYQTKRNMFKILRTVRRLIRNHELEKLTRFVDEVMGDYVTINTNRIMPWKFEFINEVYNYLGLARINEYKFSGSMKTLTGKKRLLTLFNLPIEPTNFSTVKEDNILQIRRQEITDPEAELYKKRMARFEYRMRFAKYPIERSYLYHEAAQANLDNHSFDACCLLAHKSMDEARKGNNFVWAVLSALIACKAHAILGKLERQKEMLSEAFRLAKHLKNIDLCLFIDICRHVNNEEINNKKALITSEVAIKRRMMRSFEPSFESPITNSKSVDEYK